MLAAWVVAIAAQDAAAVREAFEAGGDEDVLTLSEPLLPDPDLSFLRGASLNRLGRHEEALAELDAVDLDAPELHLERARALIALRRFEEAEAELDVEAEGDVGELLELERARLDAELGRGEAARERLRGVAEGGGRYGAPAAKMLEEMEQTFEVKARPLFGYDTNLVGLAEDAPLAREIRRESLYLGVAADARAWIIRPEPWALVAELDVEYRYYTAVSRASYADTTLSLSTWGPLADDVSLGFTVARGESWTHGDGHFRSLSGAGVGVRVREAPGFETNVYASVAAFDFYLDAPDAQDRDGVTRQVGVSQTLDVGGGWVVTPTAGLFDYVAEGSDFDHRGWQAGAAVTAPEFAGFTVTLSTTYASIRYENANSLSLAGRKRRDTLKTATLSVSKRFEGFDWTPTVSIAYSDWSSNIGAFEYDRWDTSFGLGLEKKF